MTIWTYVLEFSSIPLYILPTFSSKTNLIIEETSMMPLHKRYEMMIKSLNLVQLSRLFVKYFTTALCISWSLKMKNEMKFC